MPGLNSSFPDQAVTVLLDSGARGRFINSSSQFLKGVPLCAHKTPRSLVFADGKVTSTTITHYVELGLKLHPSYPVFSIRFDVMELGGVDIILGSDWLSQERVTLDFGANRVEFPWVVPGLQVRSARTQ